MAAQGKFLTFGKRKNIDSEPLEGNYDLSFFLPIEWAFALVAGLNIMYKEKMSVPTMVVSEDDASPKKRMADELLKQSKNGFFYFENSIAQKKSDRTAHSTNDRGKLIRYCLRRYKDDSVAEKCMPVTLQLGVDANDLLLIRFCQMVLNQSSVLEYHKLCEVIVPNQIQNYNDFAEFHHFLVASLAMAIFVKDTSNFAIESGKGTVATVASAVENIESQTPSKPSNQPQAKKSRKDQQPKQKGQQPTNKNKQKNRTSFVATAGFKLGTNWGDKRDMDSSVIFYGTDLITKNRIVLKQHNEEIHFWAEANALQVLRRADVRSVSRLLSIVEREEGKKAIAMPRYETASEEYWEDVFASESKCTSFARSACEILDEVHGCNLTHGDLKSDAFMLEPVTGKYILADFGHAMNADMIVRKGMYSGTPGWIPVDGPFERARDFDLLGLGGIMIWLIERNPHVEPGAFEYNVLRGLVDYFLQDKDTSVWRKRLASFAIALVEMELRDTTLVEAFDSLVQPQVEAKPSVDRAISNVMKSTA